MFLKVIIIVAEKRGDDVHLGQFVANIGFMTTLPWVNGLDTNVVSSPAGGRATSLRTPSAASVVASVASADESSPAHVHKE